MDMDYKDPCEKYKDDFIQFHKFIQKVNIFVDNKSTHLGYLKNIPLLQNCEETVNDFKKYIKQ